MTELELDAFERRLTGDLRAYAAAMPVDVDAVAVTDRVASARRSPWARLAARWTWALTPVGPAASAGRRRVLVLVVAAVTVALVGMALAVGAKLMERDSAPVDVAGWRPTLIAADDFVPQAVTSTDGTVWATAFHRLVRIDPGSGDVRTWDVGDGQAFLGPALVPATDGGIWLVGRRQIRHFDGATIAAPIVPPTSGGAEISSVTQEPNGTIDVVTDANVIHRWRDGTWTDVALPADKAYPTGLAADPDGGFWASLLTDPPADAIGIAHYDGVRWTVFGTSSFGGTMPEAARPAVAADGTAWVGSEPGLLWSCRGGSWSRHVVSPLGGIPVPTVGSGGTVWAVTSGEVERLTADGRVDVIGTADLPTSDRFGGDAIALTSSGEQVIASTIGGLYRLGPSGWDRLWPATSQSPVGDRVAPVSGVAAWAVAIGTGDLGTDTVWSLTTSGATSVKTPSGSTTRGDIVVDRRGTPWIAMSDGLASISGGTWRTIDIGMVRSVAVAPDGRVWTAGERGVGRLAMDGSGLDRVLPTDQAERLLQRMWGRGLVVDREGDPWLVGGTSYFLGFGVYRWQGTAWQSMTPFPEADRSGFASPEVAPDGAVWMLVDGTGSSNSCCSHDADRMVVRFADGAWTSFGVGDGLPDPSEANLNDLAIAPDGEVWATTSNGLYRFEGPRWRLAVPDTGAGSIAFAPDGTMWTTGTPGVVRWAPTTR